jgi:hypothetical protein
MAWIFMYMDVLYAAGIWMRESGDFRAIPVAAGYPKIVLWSVSNIIEES